jgi:hypothetical protein
MKRASLLILLLTLASACSDSAGETTTTTTGDTTTVTTTVPTSVTTQAETTTTTTTAVTTTTVDSSIVTLLPEGFRSPVNGLRADLETNLDRRAIAVKIDNHPEARPQSGLEDADAVIELLVEGGFTRFIAVFHDNDSEYLGPVRSIRPTDSTLLPAIPAPLAMSGGQPWVQDLTVGRGVKLIGESTAGFFRTSRRTAPHNLYADTEGIRSTADARGYSDDAPQWLYRVDEWRIPTTTANTVQLSWSNESRVTWRYEDGRYTRWYGNNPHNIVTESGESNQIAVDVLVILSGRQYTASPLLPGGGTPVPATETTGKGNAWVISRGAVWIGTWEREEITDQFRLLNPDGTEAVVPAGVVWVSIFPGDRSVTIS